jgi:hypothetical protein
VCTCETKGTLTAFIRAFESMTGRRSEIASCCAMLDGKSVEEAYDLGIELATGGRCGRWADHDWFLPGDDPVETIAPSGEYYARLDQFACHQCDATRIHWTVCRVKDGTPCRSGLSRSEAEAHLRRLRGNL